MTWVTPGFPPDCGNRWADDNIRKLDFTNVSAPTTTTSLRQELQTLRESFPHSAPSKCFWESTGLFHRCASTSFLSIQHKPSCTLPWGHLLDTTKPAVYLPFSTGTHWGPVHLLDTHNFPLCLYCTWPCLLSTTISCPNWVF